jgi:hypothetical protein
MQSSSHQLWMAIRNRPRRALLVAVVAVAVAVGGWRYTHPVTGTVTARIVLDGQVCRVPSHQTVCRKIADGGVVIVYGPITPGQASFDQHTVTINSTDSHITLHLEPGTYSLDFAVDLPYAVLLPDFGYKHNGTFIIRANQITALGRVEPGKDWVITES